MQLSHPFGFHLLLAGSVFLCYPAAYCAKAGELALYYIPQAHLQYEGTGFREVSGGWEIKVKPVNGALGLRYRTPLTDLTSLQIQYWLDKTSFMKEFNTTEGEQQEAQTRMTLNNLMIDLQYPLAHSAWKAVAGLQGVHHTFYRKDSIFRGVQEKGQVLEILKAAGVYIGLSRSALNRFYWDAEATIGHLFFTRNTQRTDRGSIHSNGYTYHFRIELGYQKNPLRIGLGFLRQMIQIQVPGGKALPNGAAASSPINKLDFFGPFLTAAYVY